LAAAVVGSALKARFGDSRASPPRLRPKSLAAEPLVFSKHALREKIMAATTMYKTKASEGNAVSSPPHTSKTTGAKETEHQTSRTQLIISTASAGPQAVVDR